MTQYSWWTFRFEVLEKLIGLLNPRAGMTFSALRPGLNDRLAKSTDSRISVKSNAIVTPSGGLSLLHQIVLRTRNQEGGNQTKQRRKRHPEPGRSAVPCDMNQIGTKGRGKSS